MEEFKIRDKNTGMVVRLRGESPPPVEALPEIFSKARVKAEKRLQTGDFKLDSDGIRELSKEERNVKIRELSSQAMGVSPDDVDVNLGMGLWERTKLDFMPDEGSRMEYLEKKFGAENVSALNVGGKMKMFYRDPKTSKMTMVDEMGASLADFTADIAGEAVTTAGAVGGAIAGTMLAPGAGTGAGAVAGATAGAAVGGFLTGVSQDVAATQLAGVETDTGEILKSRGIEAGIGVPIDLATAGLGRVISRRLGKNVVDQFVKDLDVAEKQLAKRGIKIERTTGMDVGERAAIDESVLAGKRPASSIGRKLENIRDTLGDFQRAAQGEADGVGAFGKTIQKIQADADSLVREVATQDEALANTIRKSLDRRISKMQVQEEGMDSVGAKIRGVFKLGESEAVAKNTANWKGLSELANQRGVSVTGKEAARAIRRGLNKLSDVKVKENPTLQAKLKELDDLGDNAIDFSDLRAHIEVIQDMVPQAGATGGKAAQQVAAAAADSLRGLRDIAISRGGREFAKEYDRVVGYYKNNLLGFKRGAVGRSLAEKMGGETMTNSQVANTILSDPSSVREALKAAREAGGAEGAGLIQDLRRAYMNQIGMAKGVKLGSRLKYDKEIVRELYGYGSDGVYRAGRAQRKIDALEKLNKSLEQSKVDASDLSPDDVTRVLDTLSDREQREVISSITKRAKAEAKQNELLSNVLWKKVAKGEWEAMDNEVFAQAAFTKSPQTLRKLINEMPAESREPFKQDFVRTIFGTAQDGAQINSNGAKLWNPDSLEKTLRTKKSQIKAVLGEDGYDDLVAANKFMQASELMSGQAADVALRASGGPQGFHFFLVGSILNAFRDRFMGWAYGSGAMKPLLRLMSKRVSDEQFAKNFQRVFSTMIGTRRGLEALAREAQGDPSFNEAVVNMMDGMATDGAE
jgi:hypothetical protein